MENEILLAIIQAATEFLPVSSSGHLAILSNIIGETNLFLITILHLASLLAVLIFTRKEILYLLTFKKDTQKLWIYLIIGTIPAATIGFIFKDLIENSLNSYLFIGISFLFTGTILLLTKIPVKKSELNLKNSLLIGLFQILALFPGVSRAGMTISSGLLLGIPKEKAIKFSFLLFIPLAIGANILEFGNAYFSTTLLIAFLLCFILSLGFIYALNHILKQGKFYLFSIYCFIVGVLTLYLYLISM